MSHPNYAGIKFPPYEYAEWPKWIGDAKTGKACKDQAEADAFLEENSAVAAQVAQASEAQTAALTAQLEAKIRVDLEAKIRKEMADAAKANAGANKAAGPAKP